MFALAVPIFFPALRPPFASLLKAGAKLAIEAEFEADDALADRLVDTAVSALLHVKSQDSEKDLRRRSEATVDRFLTVARASARRRGWNEQDVTHRYRKRITKLDHAISRAHRRARPPQRTALEHASELLTTHHVVSGRPDASRGNEAGSGAKLDHQAGSSQSPRRTATRA